ncbi:MAG: hypothetical protein M1370_04005 [Bacteroidetes bacterium]|nr:hypothetical protein [Bacteroidota bacterium]MCL5026373.1 hypothetical protein [Chloroflexota bacterium]
MDREELRLALADARRRQRSVEKEIRRIREESRFYRRLGFGQDIKDIQLLALEDQSRRCQAEARRLMRLLGIKPCPAPSLQSWLLLPAVLLLSFLSGLTRSSGHSESSQARGIAPSGRTVRY